MKNIFPKLVLFAISITTWIVLLASSIVGLSLSHISTLFLIFVLPKLIQATNEYDEFYRKVKCGNCGVESYLRSSPQSFWLLVFSVLVAFGLLICSLTGLLLSVNSGLMISDAMPTMLTVIKSSMYLFGILAIFYEGYRLWGEIGQQRPQ